MDGMSNNSFVMSVTVSTASTRGTSTMPHTHRNQKMNANQTKHAGINNDIDSKPTRAGDFTYFTKSKSAHTLIGLALPRACHSSEIALAGSRRLHSTLAAAPVLFAHAVVTEIKNK